MTQAHTPATQKWFRIGRSGPTVDGRHIKAEWLTEAAKTYHPELYGARLNVEHIKSYAPETPFNGYGDVLALKTEVVGDHTYLLAQIEPTDKLKALSQKKTKAYTSMELRPNFAQTGKAYLTGLALTDTPASLGTSMLAFSVDPEVYHSEVMEMSEHEAEAAAEPTLGLVQKIYQLLTQQPKALATPEPTTTTPTATSSAEPELQAAVQLLAAELALLQAHAQTQTDALLALQSQWSALQNQPAQPERAPHTGAQGYSLPDY